ncbi:MAG TPA: hypothetical protein VL025_06305, partial [Thermoanaerobaculia bacterium]|nr:hypothetical protein [Thermoanaerobaculia bacterium]
VTQLKELRQNIMLACGRVGRRGAGAALRSSGRLHAHSGVPMPLNGTSVGKMALMKSATRVTSKGQVVIPENPIDTLYGCLKDLPRDPLAELTAEHRAEIEADKRRQRHGR